MGEAGRPDEVMEDLSAPLECYAAVARIGKDWSEARRSGEIFADNALSQAMKILAGALPAVFEDLCPSCCQILSTRLSGIATGLELAEVIGRKYASVDGACTMHRTAKVQKEEENCEEDEEDEEDEEGEECSETQSVMSGSASISQRAAQKKVLTPQEREHIRYLQVVRKKDFVCMEWIKGMRVNILQGLELHTNIFSAAEQSRLLDMVFELELKGQRNELKERTYSAPRKWMQGKGRVTLQFGCCYNYSHDKFGNTPGILQDEEVDPLPPLLKSTIKRLVRWHVLPPTCVPDSCIVNIYETGDCIPPHIDHHDFLRPFCTVSLLSQCSIVFGSSLSVAAPGEFDGSFSTQLPVGSVLVLNDNGADVAKHCIPAVPSKRVSLTFRKMDPRKRPYGYRSDRSMERIPLLD
ncbi:uncharacterized protein LOC9630678 [Selaginella moellendorffii]|nr:uncharacterized protein LOC9630678 [Selaginella moellendorffii]|eukprot:XP_002962106.2 uncharacterized protein LOC9630678 [Selaginella moellendorffii]